MAKKQPKKRTGKQNANARLTRMQRATNGAKLRVQPDPPSIVQNPWNQLTLGFTQGKDGFYNLSNLYTDFLAQLGGSEGEYYEYRLISLKAWELNGGSLELSACDLIDSDKDFLMQIEDIPGRNHYACAGYLWPKAHQQRVFTCNSKTGCTAPLFHLSTGHGQSTNVKGHLRMLWKRNITSLPTFAGSSLSARAQFELAMLRGQRQREREQSLATALLPLALNSPTTSSSGVDDELENRS